MGQLNLKLSWFGNGHFSAGTAERSTKISGKEIAYEITERRPGDPATLVASSEKAKRVLNWKPTRSDLETILKDAWLWHSTHPAGYGSK